MSFMASLTTGLPPTSQHMGPSASGAHTGSLNYLSRVPSLPENIYGTNQLFSHTSGYRPADNTSHQHPMQTTSSDSLKVPSSLGQHYFVDHMLNPHPYSSLYPGFDINAVRRKNATRETTGPLKAWLSQHRKNPYPTKGEKVMLAIATRMTLTQVSTWFANARRRMKKDNFSEDDDQDDSKDGGEVRNRSGSLSSGVSRTSSEADISKESDLSKDLDNSDIEDITVATRPMKKCVQRLFSPDYRIDHVIDPSSSPESLPPVGIHQADTEPNHVRLPPVSDMMNGHQLLVKPEPVNGLTDEQQSVSQKSKIWSISEIIGSASKSIQNSETPTNYPTEHTSSQRSTVYSTNYPTEHTSSQQSTVYSANYPTEHESSQQSTVYSTNYPYSQRGYNTDYSNYMAYQTAAYASYSSHCPTVESPQTSDSENIQYL